MTTEKSADQYIANILEKADRLGICIPAWVPRNLIAEFFDCASEYGLTMAETYIKSRMRETPSTELGRLIGRS